MLFIFTFIVSALIVLVSTIHLKWWSGRSAVIVSSLLLGSLVTLMVLVSGAHDCAEGKPPTYLAFVAGIMAGAVPWCRSFSIGIRRMLAFCIAMLFSTMVGLLVSSYHSDQITGNPDLADGRFWHTALTSQYPRGSLVGKRESAWLQCFMEYLQEVRAGESPESPEDGQGGEHESSNPEP